MSFQENLVPCTISALLQFRDAHNGRYPMVKTPGGSEYYVQDYDRSDSTVMVTSINDTYNCTWIECGELQVVLNHPIEEKFSSYTPPTVTYGLKGKLIVVKEFYPYDGFTLENYRNLQGKNLKVVHAYTGSQTLVIEYRNSRYEVPAYCCTLSPEGATEYFEERTAVIGDIVRTNYRLTLKVMEAEADTLVCRVVCAHTGEYEDYEPMRVRREDCTVVRPVGGYTRGDKVLVVSGMYGRHSSTASTGKVLTVRSTYGKYVTFDDGVSSDLGEYLLELYSPRYAPYKPVLEDGDVYMTLCGRSGMDEVFVAETHLTLPGSLWNESLYVGDNSIRRAFRACGIESDVIEEELRDDKLSLYKAKCTIPGTTRILESIIISAVDRESTYFNQEGDSSEVLWIALVKVEKGRPFNLCALANGFFIT